MGATAGRWKALSSTTGTWLSICHGGRSLTKEICRSNAEAWNGGLDARGSPMLPSVTVVSEPVWGACLSRAVNARYMIGGSGSSPGPAPGPPRSTSWCCLAR